MAFWACTSSTAGLLVCTFVCHSFGGVSANVNQVASVPVLERSMTGCEVGDPIVGVAHDFIIDTIFIVLLLTGIKE